MARWFRVTSLTELEPGQSVATFVGGREVAVFNLAGRVFGLQGDCSHIGGPLSEGSVTGELVECPWHGSVFHIPSGEVRQGPAQRALRTFAVEVKDGEVGLWLPEEE